MILIGILVLSKTSSSRRMEFTEIYKQYGDKIYRVCLGFVYNSELAKDLTQETFITVWQNLESFRQDAGIGTWIYRIATNKCLRLIEKEKKRTKISFPFELEDSFTEEKQEEKLVFLRNCIVELPEIDRIIITLFMEDIAQEKIAKIIGLTHANVRVKVHRIKERLLKKFKKNGKL